MSRNEGVPPGAEQEKDPAEQEKNPAEQEDPARSRAEREARSFAQETGYKPSVNQGRHEPLPASRHAERRQEAIVRNEEHAAGRPQAAPSPRARSRRKD